MKQRLYLGTVLSLLLFLVGSCTDDYTEGTGKGKLNLNISLSDQVEAVTKADTQNNWNPQDDCLISISSQAGVIQKYEGLNDLPEELWLVSGDYSIAVTAGDSVAAGFNTPYYKDQENFTISSGEVKNTEVICHLANTLVTPYYSDELKTHLATYTLTVYNTRSTGELIFDASHEGISGYFMMSQTVKDLYWTFSGQTVDGETFSKSDVISNVKSRTNYKMNFHFDPSYEDGGGILVGIEVVEPSDDPNEDVVTIIMPPSVTGHEFDINSTVFRPEGSLEDIKIWINGSSEIKSALFSMDASTQKAFGLPSSQFDFIKMDAEVKEQFASLYKISCKEQAEDTDGDGKEDVWRMLITIAGETMETFENGEKFSFTISVEDANGYTKEKVLSVEITDAIVMTEEVDIYTVWTNRATLKGSIITPTQENIQFQYRKITDLSYNVVDVNIDGDKFTADIQELEPGTTYEFRAIAGASFADTKYFTTEATAQLPNSSFEYWQQVTEAGGIFGNVAFWAIYGSGQTKFWDSGNKGSASAGANVTYYDESIAVHGSRSARLKSDWLVIKFAAGNLFTGEFVRLIGTNGAELSFGREFTTRPKALKFWYKYEPVAIDRVGSGLPQSVIDDGAVKGNMDKAHVYIALGDWGEPVKIDNTDFENGLFKTTDPNIIAYGELVENQTTEGDYYTTIELDYRTYTRKPKYIVVVASSSKYGDYFTGGAGSTLWLDDFELIYE
ncbi:MAG: DUF4493 domain-containing protein [Tannerellaceae bacterium]|nr:DUF4493 domain-containing protein [Tannerellaceae bacterium]